MIKVSAVIILLFFISCSDQLNLPSGNEAVYFPLQIKNKWTYNDGSTNWTQEVTSVKEINGINYFALVTVYQRSIDTSFYRASENKIYVNYQGKDFLFIDFNKSVGEEWNSYQNYYGKVNQKNLTVDVPAGRFNDVIEIVLDDRQAVDAAEFRKYAPGVGMLKLNAFRRESVLISAYINGKNFPQ